MAGAVSAAAPNSHSRGVRGIDPRPPSYLPSFSFSLMCNPKWILRKKKSYVS
jgi:hypothetical protein